MTSKVNDVVMPGDTIDEISDLSKNKKVILGPGLRKNNNNNKVFACKGGILKMKAPNTFWIDSYQKRYIPNRGELVVGVVVQKSGDIFKVDIGSAEMASLSYLAFEGATKKNRPDVNVGDVIYAKLVIANKDYEPELVCVDSLGKKGKLGVLMGGGFLFNCSINLVRKILNESCPLIRTIQSEMQVPMEIVIGMNGRIWIKTKYVQDCIAVANAIITTEYVSNDDIGKMCDNIANIFTGFG